MNTQITKLYCSKIFLLILFGIIFKAVYVKGQSVQAPEFHCDLINVIEPKTFMSRLNIFTKVGFNQIQFAKTGNTFSGYLQLKIKIFDTKNNEIKCQSTIKKIEINNYEETNSLNDFVIIYKKFDLNPDKYKVEISLTDKITNQTNLIKKNKKLTDFKRKKIMMSDIALVRNIEIDSLGIKGFSPDISEYIVNLNKKVYAYFEIYNKKCESDTYEISFTIKNPKGKTIFENKYKRRPDGFRTLESFALPVLDFIHGKYQLEIRADNSSSYYSVSKHFTIHSPELPSSITDIDLAIKQLCYIASKEDYKALKGTSKFEKLIDFIKFWKKKDPTPGTPVNESMNEYYRRINYSNEYYSGFNEGWKTDMGMVYIMFGKPTEIERHPFDSGTKPSEIWFYQKINRKFVFVDETGVGQYRLLPYYWSFLHIADK